MAGYSRRQVLWGLGGAAAASSLPVHAYAQLDPQPWYFLTDAEARFLAAACDVLIPADEFPSASQAGVVDFIDLQLSGPYGIGDFHYLQPPFPENPLATQGYQAPFAPAELWRRGMAAADRIAGGFAGLDDAGRQAFIRRLSEGGIAPGDWPDAAQFWTEFSDLTNQGYFADPIHGGNKDYAGWRMVGFPGAHAYYLSFVDAFNVPYPAPPKGIAHRPETHEGWMPKPPRSPRKEVR